MQLLGSTCKPADAGHVVPARGHEVAPVAARLLHPAQSAGQSKDGAADEEAEELPGAGRGAGLVGGAGGRGGRACWVAGLALQGSEGAAAAPTGARFYHCFPQSWQQRGKEQNVPRRCRAHLAPLGDSMSHPH